MLFDEEYSSKMKISFFGAVLVLNSVVGNNLEDHKNSE